MRKTWLQKMEDKEAFQKYYDQKSISPVTTPYIKTKSGTIDGGKPT